ncbi:MAG: phosphotransferase [Mycobacteriales bacterium]|nr:phosphotransferase [Mycobacteriales bacterium]
MELLEELPAALRAEVQAAVAALGARIEDGWREGPRRFLRAGAWFVTVSDRPSDVAPFAVERARRAVVGSSGPLRAPEVVASGEGWYVAPRVEAVPFEQLPPGVAAAALDRLATLELPPAPPGPAEGGLVRKVVQRARLELGPVPRADRALARRLLAQDGPQVTVHGDLHAGNVLPTRDALHVIDWETTTTGPAGADVARLAALLAPATGDALLEEFASYPRSPSPARLRELRYACTVQAAADLLLIDGRDGQDRARGLAMVARLDVLRPAAAPSS